MYPVTVTVEKKKLEFWGKKCQNSGKKQQRLNSRKRSEFFGKSQNSGKKSKFWGKSQNS